MREIYLFDGTGREGLLLPLGDGARVDPALIQSAQGDNIDWTEPMLGGGDPDLVYMTAFKQPRKPGGLVVVFSAGGESLFCVIARTYLDQVAAASHLSSMVANLRYGADIFEGDGGD